MCAIRVKQGLGDRKLKKKKFKNNNREILAAYQTPAGCQSALESVAMACHPSLWMLSRREMIGRTWAESPRWACMASQMRNNREWPFPSIQKEIDWKTTVQRAAYIIPRPSERRQSQKQCSHHFSSIFFARKIRDGGAVHYYCYSWKNGPRNRPVEGL